MLTIAKILQEFTYIKAWTGSAECYHETATFEGQETFCDLYFNAVPKQITQQQVDLYNDFKQNFNKYLYELESYMQLHLTTTEARSAAKIQEAALQFDVIEMPRDNYKYNMVLVCSKNYRKFRFFKRSISLRVEFLNRIISSIEKKAATTEENGSK